ncbi:MAG: tetratricopeptide repeat protein [Imperialibacter sp.]|uniref:tetratricopeptide repeat protein n=1 Tax=Imperialibacter sp. TaxID=2038411 RepID=UPI0032ECFAD1
MRIKIALFITFAYFGAFAESTDSLYFRAESLLNTGDIAQAEAIAKKATEFYKGNGDETMLAKTYFLLGYIDDERNYLANAAIYYLEAIKLKADDYTRLSCLKNLGRIFKAYNRTEDAEQYYLEALKVAAGYSQKEEAGILYNLGNLYKEVKNFDQAKEAYLKAYTISLEAKDYVRLANLTNQIGLVFKELKDYPSAREYYFRMINAEEQLQEAYPKFAGRAWHNIAITHLEEGNYQEAVNGCLTSLKWKEKTGKDQFITWLDLGDAYLRSGKREEALKAWSTALAAMGPNLNDPDQFIIYRHLATAYENDLEQFKTYSNRYAVAWEQYHITSEQLTDLDQSYRFHITLEKYWQQQREKEQFQMWLALVAGLVIIFGLILAIIYLARRRMRAQLETKLNHILKD